MTKPITNRVQWNTDFSVGNETLDGQRKAILIQCNRLADCIADVDQQCGMDFNDAFNAFLVQVREHFATERAMSSLCGYPALQEKHDEFDYLANEIITTENFEQVELQRFVVLWWVGHLIESAKMARPFVEG